MNRALIICLILIASAAYAQSTDSKSYQLPTVFRHLNRANGLAGNTVSAILQDRNGFIWFGTDKGLNRYDGRNFDLFVRNPNDINSISGNNITALYEDRKGRLWIGTNDNGITIYDPVTEKFKRYEHNDKNPASINTGYVAQIYEDSKGRFWICLYGGGLELFDEAKQRFVHHVWRANDPYSIAGIKCKSIYEISPDKYIVGTFEAGGNLYSDLRASGGINQYDFKTNRFSPLLVGDVLINRKYTGSVRHMTRLVHTIVPDSSGNLWFGTYAGLLRYNIASKTFWGFKAQDDDSLTLSNDIVRSICELNGKLYIGTEGGGLNILDTTTYKFTNYKNNPLNPNSISDDFVKCVYKDRNNRVWIGTIGGGVNIVDPHKQDFIVYPYSFLKIRPNARIEDVTIYAMSAAGAGKVLLGTCDGLTVLDTRANTANLIQKFRTVNGRKEIVKAHAICSSASGDYWVTFSTDIWRYHTQNGSLTEHKYSKYKSREPLSILSLIERDDTSLVASVFGKYNYIVYTNRYKIDTLLNGIKRPFVKDRDGNLWASFYKMPRDLVVKIDKSNKVTKYDWWGIDKEKPSESIESIFLDSKNNLWVATNRRLNKYDIDNDKSISCRRIKNLPDSSIRSITEDGDGNMWFTTNDALVKMTRDNEVTLFEPYKEMPVHKPEYRMMYDDEEDAIYFAANEGLVKFYPKKLIDRNTVPPIYITGFKLFNKAVQADSSALVKRLYHFAYNQNFITINFSVLNYSENVVYNYAYKLDGLNNDWVNVGSKYEANFTNLQPGTYVFKVRASTRDGKYVRESREVTIVIATPWWQSWWFYSACFLFVVAVVYSYNRYRTRAFLKQTKLLESQVAERTSQYKEQKEKAETGERLRQQFLANMSHEIRTPMNAVNSFVHLLMEKDPKPEQMQYLSAITKSSDLLLHIINDVLDLSKMEVGKLQLENISFSLKQVVTSVADTLSVLANEKHLQLTVSISEDVPDTIIGDPYRLSQVLLNLCGNSIKFTDKGRVTISAELSKDDTAGIKFSISDTGIGIPPEKLRLLFKDFAQVNISDTRTHGGTGLGLSISKGLVTLMGGNISAESIPGVGSVFSFTIPLVSADVQEADVVENTARPIDGSVLNGLRILLVDDNEYNRLAVIDTLNLKANVTIDTATNGRQAIDLLQDNSYDIVLMDAQMPVMSGIEATKYIRSKFSAPKNIIPIIAMTASVQQAFIQDCLDSGMNVCVVKPFNTQTLIREMAILTGRLNINPVSSDTIAYNKERSISGEVVDLSGLVEFCESNEHRMQQYISLYLKGIAAFCDDIEFAVSENDYTTIKELTHAFRPKWSMMGMKRALTIADRLEVNEEGFTPACKDDIQQLLNDVRTSVVELEKFG